ncbi:N-acetylglucosamine-6-phosphate deacetylase [Vibrio wakamikoensis]|uniref:N-acetylglucosamine-6-phosphate deacetylase n=1 Tax=Vibrio wakamikoensis TaxID=2910251 RepID=UPI003D1DD338
MTLRGISAHRIFDGTTFHFDSVLVYRDDIVVDILPKAEVPSDLSYDDYPDKTIVPGFIDIQVNGGGEVMFNNTMTVEGINTICKAHRKHGTAYLLPTLISATTTDMTNALNAVANAIEQRIPGVAGIHLEGPWLNANKKGAHDAGKFYAPSVSELESFPWLAMGTTLVTLAPECVDTEVLAWLKNNDVVVSCGHSNASSHELSGEKLPLIDGFTHLFNAMSPLEGREPGVVGTALMADHAWCSIIVDDIHVDSANVMLAKRLKRQQQLLIVTDAMASVGSISNSFVLDGEQISVQNGRLVNAQGALAGAHIGMDQSVANVIQWGIEEAEAFRMASMYPARAINRSDLGTLKSGSKASVTILNSDYRASHVMVDGQLLS